MTREKDNMKTITCRRSAGPGFTLVELMVVVSIISLLLLIGMPSALVIQKNIAAKASEVTLGTIATALKGYHNDFGEYPPSNSKGAETICRLLTGYPGDADGNQQPGADPKTDDGCAGFGFRTTGAGRNRPVHGPYFGAEKLDTTGGSEPRFADAFRQPVMYYRYNGGYNSGDNPEGPSDVADYAKNDSGQFYRNDYLLITKGPDGSWTKPRNGGDDITNFK